MRRAAWDSLSNSDRITMNRERVLSDAKARALELVRSGYEPPLMRTDIPAPGENILAALKMGVYLMRQGDFISDHEQKLGNKIAEVLCGGNVTSGTPISEQYLLDLEREAFKSLCGEKKTQETNSVHAEDRQDVAKLMPDSCRLRPFTSLSRSLTIRENTKSH